MLNDSCNNIKQELDFINEKNNTLIFQGLFEDSDNVLIPRVYSKLTTKKIIVMEYIPGIKIDEIKNNSVEEGEVVSKRLMTTFIMCLLKNGYLHADPHAGNIAIVNDQIILYDFGIIAKYNINIKDALRDIFMAFLSKNTDVVIGRILENDIIFMKSKTKIVTELNSMEYIVLYRLVNYLFEYSESLDIQKFESNIRSDAFLDVNNLPFEVNPEMLLLFKTFATLEGVCKNIYPEFNYFVLMDDIFNEFMDVDVLSQKIANDIKLLIGRLKPERSNNNLDSKVQSARIDQIDNDANTRYKWLVLITIMSSLLNMIALI